MTAPGPRLDEIQAIPAEAVEAVHAYAAAGFVVCGQQTGGAISAAGGYSGPKLLTTADDSQVTCATCKALL